MSLARLILPLAASALVLAGPAAAAPVSASSDDAQDGAWETSTDVQQVRTTFDAEAGTWSLTVRFWGPVSETSWAMINAIILRDCSDAATSFANLRASTRPSSSGAFGLAGAAADGPQPDGSVGASPYTSATRTISDDQREITLDAASPRLVGRSPGCVQLKMSHNTVIDTLDTPAQFPPSGPSTTPPPPPPSGGSTPPPPPPPAATAVKLALAPGTRTLSLRTLKVTLQPFDIALTGSARLTARRAPLLAKAEWKAAAQKPVTVRLKLTSAGRRWVRRHPRATVRLTVSARQPAAALVSKSFTLKLRP